MTEFNPPYPSKQIAFHQLLSAARATVLKRAISEILGSLDPVALGAELDQHAPGAARQVLARAGIRDEYVFATPQVLQLRPTTLGYYRLLLGASQKAFYRAETGLSRFKSMETNDLLRPALAVELPALCSALNAQLAELVLQLSPKVSAEDVDQLPLLTLGAQFDGGWRNGIGKAATAEVFLAIREVVESHISAETASTLTLRNSSGRTVQIALASDPDVAVTEHFDGGEAQLPVAIEIKGGTDRSNAHNRAGEAEKSHQKVRGTARDFWTIIATKGIDTDQLGVESPTTRRWYDIAGILSRSGSDWDRFQHDLRGAIGI